MTKRIYELEHHFKVKLFERNGSGIKLTPAGESLRLQADQLFFFTKTWNLKWQTFLMIKKESFVWATSSAKCGFEYD